MKQQRQMDSQKPTKPPMQINSDVLVRTKFNSWIDVYGQKIGINQKTANEWTFSKDAQNLYRKNKPAYADKVNAFGVADELLQASRDYVGEEIKHTRKDSFREFASDQVESR